jgi:hypothetical protein
LTLEQISDIDIIEISKNTHQRHDKERIREEVKSRVRKLQREGKIDGDSESIEEILIENKRDYIKRKENKISKYIKYNNPGVLSESYEGSSENDKKDFNQKNDNITVAKLDPLNPRKISKISEIQDEIICLNDYENSDNEVDLEEIEVEMQKEATRAIKDKQKRVSRFEKRKKEYLMQKKNGKKISACKIKLRENRTQIALSALNQPFVKDKGTIDIKPKEYKTYGANEIIEEAAQRKIEKNRDGEKDKSKQKGSDSDQSNKCFLSGSSTDEDKSKEEKLPKGLNPKFQDKIIQEITAILSSSEDEKQKLSAPAPPISKSSVSPIDLHAAFQSTITQKPSSDKEDYHLDIAEEAHYDLSSTQYNAITQHENYTSA